MVLARLPSARGRRENEYILVQYNVIVLSVFFLDDKSYFAIYYLRRRQLYEDLFLSITVSVR